MTFFEGVPPIGPPPADPPPEPAAHEPLRTSITAAEQGRESFSGIPGLEGSGWKRQIDSSNGLAYYSNDATGQTAWATEKISRRLIPTPSTVLPPPATGVPNAAEILIHERRPTTVDTTRARLHNTHGGRSAISGDQSIEPRRVSLEDKEGRDPLDLLHLAADRLRTHRSALIRERDGSAAALDEARHRLDAVERDEKALEESLAAAQGRATKGRDQLRRMHEQLDEEDRAAEKLEWALSNKTQLLRRFLADMHISLATSEKKIPAASPRHRTARRET